MKIPRKIKLLDTEYTIRVVESHTIPGKAGVADYERKEILLAATNKEQAEVLFHEIAHLIVAHLELTTLIDKDHEELISNAYALGFYSLFKNNKGMFK